MRCLTLADALREQRAQCTFLCRPHQGHLLGFIAQRGHQAVALPELQEVALPNLSGAAHAHWLGTDWVTDSKDTKQALGAHTNGQPVDWLVVDHYALDACWEEALRSQAKRIMVIDDLADRPHVCDLLLDQNLGRSYQDYGGLLRDRSITLIGPEYALLRPEFAALRTQSLARRQSNPQLHHLLVSMGGVDKDNVTGLVLNALQSCKLSVDLSVTVVMGANAPWLAQVQAQAEKMPWYTEVLVGVDNMAQLMADSDLAIGAAGGTAWERCCLGVPSLVFVLAKNQLPGAVALQNAGAAVVMEVPQQIEGFVGSLHTELFGQESLAKVSKAAAAVTDGEGCQRVVELLLEDIHG